MDRPASSRSRGRRFLTLCGAVVLAHLGLVSALRPVIIGDSRGAQPVRIDVAFVREIAPTLPAPRVTQEQPPPRRTATPAAAAAASAPGDLAPAAREAEAQAEAQAEAAAALAQAAARAAAASASASASAVAAAPDPDPVPLDPAASQPPLQTASAAASGAAASAPVALAAAASAAASEDFDWPPSTRLTYRVSGNYRGPVEGQAQVEWLRSGPRYQVFMDLSIGPSFAPLMSRRVSSEGLITPSGLSPRRYEETTRVVMRDTRQLRIDLDADQVRLANGRTQPRPAGVQDSASQFVQLTWLFTRQPQWLATGNAIELPLALPRRLDNWIYDVVGPETLATPFGAVDAVHVRPRSSAPRAGELVAEIWVAPSLQYLPVRILIRQDAENFVDLLIEKLPLQAAPRK